jgi:methylmalonyl-CoA/ethylmalonyl-CoA epimerase
VRLTHLDAGNVKLQLVEPLQEDHPLCLQLTEKGEHLHHLCWAVDDTEKAMARLSHHGLKAKAGEPHPAPEGGTAAFIEPEITRGLLWEITSKKKTEC